MTKLFKPSWESLREFQCPEWYRDAKIGMWSHWGPQSVPMYGDNYANRMYMEHRPEYLHHLNMFGHPSKFGYKDVIKRWKAENFNADYMMDIYIKAGAKYFFTIGTHHDNYDLWQSGRRWSAPNVGPKQDIVAAYQKAAQNHHLPFGISEHLALSYSWFSYSKGCDTQGPYQGVPYDGVNPDFFDLYHRNEGQLESLNGKSEFTMPTNETWAKEWHDRIIQMIDRYEPDMLYSDSSLPFGSYGLDIVAHLYNMSINKHGSNQAIYFQKDRNPLVYRIGLLDVERTQLENAMTTPWQNDTTACHWFYSLKYRYKPVKQIIEILIDVVAKNGNLLMNLPQRADGTIDDQCQYIVDNLSHWLEINGEGIYGTRPWYIASEGDGFVKPAHACDEPEASYDETDYRFTQKDNVIYAFQMGWPVKGKSLIKSFGSSHSSRGIGTLESIINIECIELLGYHTNIKFKQTLNGLELYNLPNKQKNNLPHCFKITTKKP